METTYKKKLSNPLWQKRRLEILQRDQFTCQMCTDTKTELHVHHKNYTGEPWEAPEEDLTTFCAHCHKAESEIEKTGDKLLIVNKIDSSFYAKTKKGRVLIGKIMPDDTLTLAMKINKPKELLTILQCYIK